MGEEEAMFPEEKGPVERMLVIAVLCLALVGVPTYALYAAVPQPRPAVHLTQEQKVLLYRPLAGPLSAFLPRGPACENGFAEAVAGLALYERCGANLIYRSVIPKGPTRTA